MVVQSRSFVSRLEDSLIALILGLLAISCLLPFLHIIAVSFSETRFATANLVRFLPRGFTTIAYEQVFATNAFLRAFLVSVFRVVAGTSLNIFLILLTAYPLSHSAKTLKGRTAMVWFLIFPMLFNGGLIPTYMLIRNLGLIDRYAVLILPTAVQMFSVILMMNFFWSLPDSLYDAALMDGAGHLTILFKIYVPLSMASISTLTLFAMVMHWNEWFTGLIYLNDQKKFPLQTYLRTLIVELDWQAFEFVDEEEAERLAKISDRSFKSAQIMLSTVPILSVYPFIQRHFVKGIVLGALKD
jgi:putative aldouronate transport system permease protein